MDQNQLTAKNSTIAGYAILFGVESVDLGDYTEVIEHGALDGVDLSKVKALIQHDVQKLLGSVDAGNLYLEVDQKGLFFILELNDTTYATDLYKNIQERFLTQCSFGFTAAEDYWIGNVRHVVKIGKLHEISVVAFPAYEETEVVALRSQSSEINRAKRVIQLLDFL